MTKKVIALSIVALVTLSTNTPSFAMMRKIKQFRSTLRVLCIPRSFFQSKKDLFTPTPMDGFCISKNFEKINEIQDISEIAKEHGLKELHNAYQQNNKNLLDVFMKNGTKDDDLPFVACYHGKLEMLKVILANSPEETINNSCSEKLATHILGIPSGPKVTLLKVMNNSGYEQKNACMLGTPLWPNGSLLWIACSTGNKEIVEWLLLNGAKINNENIKILLSVTGQLCKDMVSNKKMLIIKQYLKWALEYNNTKDKEEIIRKNQNDEEAFEFFTELNKRNKTDI